MGSSNSPRRMQTISGFVFMCPVLPFIEGLAYGARAFPGTGFRGVHGASFARPK